MQSLFHKKIQLPNVNCNYYYHNNIHVSECECLIFYLFKVPQELIRIKTQPPYFCQFCLNSIKNSSKNWQFKGTQVTFVYKELEQLQEYVSQKELLQLASNQQIFKNLRLTKKVKNIFKTIKECADIFSGQIDTQKFQKYCNNRKVLLKLVSDHTTFHSSLFQEGLSILQQVQKNTISLGQADFVQKFPISVDKYTNIYYQIQSNWLFQYYRLGNLVFVEIFDFINGKFIEKIMFQLKASFYNIDLQLKISQNSKFLGVLSDYTDLYVYNFETKQYLYADCLLFREDRKLLTINNAILLLSNNKLLIIDYDSLSFKTDLDFSDLIDKSINQGVCFQANRQILYIHFKNQLALIDMKKFQLLKIKRQFCLKTENIDGRSDLQVFDCNDLLLFTKVQYGEVRTLIYSYQTNKIIRNSHTINEYNQNFVKQYIVKNFLAISNGYLLSFYNFGKGTKLIEYIFNQADTRFGQPVLLYNECLLVANNNYIQVFKLIQE